MAAVERMTSWGVDLSHVKDPARVIERACRSLATAGRQALRGRKVADLVTTVDLACRKWLDSNFIRRKLVIEQVQSETGMAPAVIGHGLDVELSNYSAEALMKTLRSEFGNPDFLDQFCPNEKSGLVSTARSHGIVAYWFSSTIPALPALEIVRGLLVKSPALGRLSRRETIFAPSFLQTLAELMPEVGEAVWLGTWSPDVGECLEVISRECTAAVVYGGPETCSVMRQSLAPHLEYIEHGPHLGITLIDLNTIERAQLEDVARSCAYDILTFDQRACISPQIYFLREGSAVSVEAFARSLAQSMAELEAVLPPSVQSLDDLVARHLAAKQAEFFGGQSINAGSGYVLIESSIEQSWPTGGGRIVRLISVKEFDEAIAETPVRPFLQNAAIRVNAAERERVIEALVEARVSRICQPGRMAHASMQWHHDGIPCLERLTRWTDLEMDG